MIGVKRFLVKLIGLAVRVLSFSLRDWMIGRLLLWQDNLLEKIPPAISRYSRRRDRYQRVRR